MGGGGAQVEGISVLAAYIAWTTRIRGGLQRWVSCVVHAFKLTISTSSCTAAEAAAGVAMVAVGGAVVMDSKY